MTFGLTKYIFRLRGRSDQNGGALNQPRYDISKEASSSDPLKVGDVIKG